MNDGEYDVSKLALIQSLSHKTGEIQSLHQQIGISSSTISEVVYNQMEMQYHITKALYMSWIHGVLPVSIIIIAYVDIRACLSVYTAFEIILYGAIQVQPAKWPLPCTGGKWKI